MSYDYCPDITILALFTPILLNWGRLHPDRLFYFQVIQEISMKIVIRLFFSRENAGSNRPADGPNSMAAFESASVQVQSQHEYGRK
jgi:hypothetical protein